MAKTNISGSEQGPYNKKQVGEVAFVDFYFEGFSEDATEVVVQVGKEYTIKSIIRNVCEKREFYWLIWGATPTSPTTPKAKVKFNQVGIFTVELMLRTSHVGGGSVCSSNGEKRKVNYVRVVK